MISDRAIRSALARFRLAAAAKDGTDPPRELEIILDASVSMTAGDGSKQELGRELSIFLLRAAEAAGMAARLVVLKGDGRDRVISTAESSRVTMIAFDGVRSFDEAVRQAVQAGTTGIGDASRGALLRVVVSDFLFPDDPAPLVRTIAPERGRLWLVQLLADEELNPMPAGRFALEDLETDESVELVLDEAAIAGYRGRLNDLCQRLSASCRDAAASLSTVSAADGIEKLCENSLVTAGLLVAH